jgi:hypothetical protein
MREIKFRAWDKVNKEMSYVTSLSWMNNSFRLDTICVDKDPEEWVDEPNFVLMQYTGISVKGKEIYDGDILSGKWAVEWDNERGFWVVFNPSKHYCALGEALYNVPELEVIGNIYENIELWELDKE